jgi:hypothetical protein
MPYTLTWSQDRAYKDVIDLYAGELDLTAAADGFIRGKGVPTLLTADTDIRCLIEQTDYATQPATFGRTFTANLLTNDVVEMPMGVAIEDAQFFLWKTCDGLVMNRWFAVSSDPQSWPSAGSMKSNYQRLRVKECVDPTQVPSDAEVA